MITGLMTMSLSLSLARFVVSVEEKKLERISAERIVSNASALRWLLKLKRVENFRNPQEPFMHFSRKRGPNRGLCAIRTPARMLSQGIS